MTKQEKYDAWREVDKEFLRNTAADMVEDYFDGMCHEDILGELGYKTWDGMLENLAIRFEHMQDANVAENDTWISIIEQRKEETLKLAKAKPEEKIKREMRCALWICHAYNEYIHKHGKIPGATEDDVTNMLIEAVREFESEGNLNQLPITDFAIKKFDAEMRRRNPIKEGVIVRVAGEGKPFADLDWVLDNVTDREQLKRWIGAVIGKPESYYILYTVQEIVGDKALCKPANDDAIVFELKDLRATNAKGDE